MRVTILSVGSRGDVQPLLAFGAALTSAGHEVRCASFPKFEQLVRGAGLEFLPLAEGGMSQDSDAEEGRGGPMLLRFLKDTRAVGGQRLRDALTACEGAQAIVANELAMLVAWQVARRRGARLLRVRLCPPPAVANGPLARPARALAWLALRPWLASGSREAGLPPLPRREPLSRLAREGVIELHAYSPALAGEDAHAGGSTYVTGFWFLEGRLDPAPTPQLLEFLGSGPPPVCIDFGSMPDADPAATDGAGARGARPRRATWGPDPGYPQVPGCRAAGQRLRRGRRRPRGAVRALCRRRTPRRCGNARGDRPGRCAVGRGAAHARPACLGAAPARARCGARTDPTT